MEKGKLTCILYRYENLPGRFPKIREPQYRPSSTIVLIKEIPHKIPLNSGHPHRGLEGLRVFWEFQVMGLEPLLACAV